MTLKEVYETVKKVIIYEIVCNITGERYIGSSFRSLNFRLYEHIDKDNTTSSKQIINRGDYTETELEIFYTRFKLARLLKEQYWMDNTENINIKRAYTSKKLRNQLRKKERDKRKLQVSIKCPCGGQYKHSFKAKHFKTKRHMRYIDTQNR